LTGADAKLASTLRVNKPMCLESYTGLLHLQLSI
jgi:hypothetical protein